MYSYPDRYDVELTGVAGGFASVDLPNLDPTVSFSVKSVRARLDTVDLNASAIASIIVADVATIAAAPPGEDIAYEGDDSGSPITLTAHATDLSFADQVATPAQFTPRSNTMQIGGNVTATGAYKIYLNVEVEIFLPG